ncbi:mandelamide amidase [Collimonas sp. OK607]|nr:indoleacetamide hydrolase [Collimonas sp. OK607]SFB00643.1 mandelamide amidase [Collimonas sp. OK607]
MKFPKSMSRRSFVSSLGALAVAPGVNVEVYADGGKRSSKPRTIGKTQQLSMTATQVVAAIAAGQLSAETYVRTLLDRADALGSLRAFITLNRVGAIAAARAVDAARAAGKKLPRLAGLPIVVKDNINTKELPTTGATPALMNFRPTADANVLKTLVNAGAIIIGKTNMHELVFGVTTTNFAPFAGVARNPYDTSRMVGGSSGGTGVAIAARMATVGLGTDTGGSVRIPAALNGIAGLRPSVGNGGGERRYDGTGVLPLSHTRDTVGPMGRTVADVALLDSVISGAAIPAPATLNGLRFGVPATYWDVVDDQVLEIMNAAKSKLTAAGVTFISVDLPSIRGLGEKTGFQLVLHEATIDIPAYLKASGASGITLSDIAEKIADPDVQNGFKSVTSDSTAGEYSDALNVYRPQMRAIFDIYFIENRIDAIFFPTTPVPAVPIDFVYGSSTVSVNGGPAVDEFATFIRNCDPGSIVGIPGLTLPAGLTSRGLPVGMALDGPVGSDKKLLSIGLAMEKLFGVLPAPNI